MITITPRRNLRGEISIPGDKSISHRGIMLGALAQGTTRITNFLQGADCLSTISCFRKMGIHIDNRGTEVIVTGKGLHGLAAPADMLNVGNSGTTSRLISGILAGQDFISTLNGDASIQSRPMGRIMIPLNEMGAYIESLNNNNCVPLRIGGGKLHSISYQSPVASAQVKSCILFAGMYADDGITSVTEPTLSRNHSELMLCHFGAVLRTEDTSVSIEPEPTLIAQDICVPGDISSAAYFIAAGLLVPDSEILIKNVGINPTRDGFLRVCKAMGANIQLLNQSHYCGEPSSDILVKSSSLTGTILEGDIIPTLIDEIPMIAIMAAFAQGETIIRDAAELKVKESDRIAVIVENLAAMGAHITPTDDGMIIQGGFPLHGTIIDSHMDHRIAMSFAIGGIAINDDIKIKGGDYVKISYPQFYEDLDRLSQ